MARFRLVTADGEALGTVDLLHAGVPIGAVIVRGVEPDVRVVAVLPAENPDEAAVVLVVEPV